MNSKAALSMTKIVIIAVVAMLVATILIFLLLPAIEEEFGECSDVCHHKEVGVVTTWTECGNFNRMIIYYPNGISGDHESYKWHYKDTGYTTYYDSLNLETLGMLIDRVKTDYENGVITEGSYHWFMCVAGEIT